MKQFIDLGSADDLTHAGLSLMSDSFEETVKDELYREFHEVKQWLAESSRHKLVPHTRRPRAEVGSAWRAGLDERYREAQVTARSVSECSSYVSMPVQHKAEDVQSFDL